MRITISKEVLRRMGNKKRTLEGIAGPVMSEEKGEMVKPNELMGSAEIEKALGNRYRKPMTTLEQPAGIYISVMIGFVTCAQQEIRQTKKGEIIPIISYEDIKNADGSYKYSYVTGHGIKVSEEGHLKNLTRKSEDGKREEAAVGMTARGAYSYPVPGGGEVSVVWTADENGFRPKVTISPAGTAPRTKDHLEEQLGAATAEEAPPR